MGKLINRIPGPRLLISSLPGSSLRTHDDPLSKHRDINKRSQSLAWYQKTLTTFSVLTRSRSTFEHILKGPYPIQRQRWLAQWFQWKRFVIISYLWIGVEDIWSCDMVILSLYYPKHVLYEIWLQLALWFLNIIWLQSNVNHDLLWLPKVIVYIKLASTVIQKSYF